MRGKVAKAIRKNVYGNRLQRKEKMRQRDFRMTEKGTIVDVGSRRIYQQVKKRVRSMSIVTKQKMIRDAQKAQKLNTAIAGV